MSTRAEAFEAESPFLSEAPRQEWEDEVDALARRLSPAAREHLERALEIEEGEDEAEAESELEGHGPWELENGGTTVAREAAFAVPPFSETERRRVAAPLLGPKDAAKAVAQNAKLHPSSGVSAAALRGALADYVDLDAVSRALSAAGVAPGKAPFDAVLIEAIHTFQAKCYLRPKAADGVAGPSTLETLGFIRHKLRRPDATFAGAKQDLMQKASEIEAALGGRFQVARWFADFINPAFLGHGFTYGVHPSLIEALRKAERHLLGQPAYAGLTPVALGRALGFTPDRQTHSGGRPNPRLVKSFHASGLAIDIRAHANPWISGNPDAKNGNQRFTAVMERATRLLQGKPERIDPAYLSRLGSQATAAICAQLRSLSETLKAYLALAKDRDRLRAAIERQQAVRGVLTGGESVDRAVERWGKEIQADADALHNQGNFNGRDARNGFFDLPTDLVVALRDRAGLAWGAVDLGVNQSGDVMHFDLRCLPVGKALRPGYCPHGAPTPAPKPKPASKPKPKATTTAKQPASRVDPPGRTLYAKAAVQAPKSSAWVGIFVPEKFRARADVDLVIYLHGLLSPCASPGPDIDRYWDTGLRDPKADFGTGPSALREALNASSKSAILVAPSLGTYSLAGGLTAPGGLDALIEQVLKTLRERGQLSVAPQTARHIVLAGHSKAGSHMRGIVAAKDSTAARIRQVWGFDCFYNDLDPKAWTTWAKAGGERRFFHYYVVGYDKNKHKLGPWRRSEILRDLVAKERLSNVELIDVRKEAGSRQNHCSTPMAFFQKRLEASTFLAGV